MRASDKSQMLGSSVTQASLQSMARGSRERRSFCCKSRVGRGADLFSPWISGLVGEGQLTEDGFSQGVHLYPHPPACKATQRGCGQRTSPSCSCQEAAEEKASLAMELGGQKAGERKALWKTSTASVV